MLAPANADLVRRDRALPGLATLLDPEAFLAVMRGAFPGVEIAHVRPTYVRYKPGTNCLVRYEINTGERTVPVHAKTFCAESAVKYGASRLKRHVPSVLGAGSVVVEDVAAVICVFPNDHDLKALRNLSDPSLRRRLLCGLFENRPELWDGKLHDLQYKPERRYVTRLDTVDGPQAVLKFYKRSGYPAAKAIAGSGLEPDGALGLPALCGSSDEQHVLAFEWQSGVPLCDRLDNADLKPSVIERTGAALAGLHCQRAANLPERNREIEIDHLHRQVSAIEFLCPHLAVPTAAVADRISSQLAQAPITFGPVHGDFNDQQILLSDGGVTILDLDEAALGDPAYDLGLFIAHLERYALTGILDSERVGQMTAALLRGYGHATGQPPPAHTRVYAAFGLLQLAVEPFRTLVPDWPTQIEAMLDRADALLGRDRRRLT